MLVPDRVIVGGYRCVHWAVAVRLNRRQNSRERVFFIFFPFFEVFLFFKYAAYLQEPSALLLGRAVHIDFPDTDKIVFFHSVFVKKNLLHAT